MEGVSCKVCGLRFNNAASCAAHQVICSDEVFDMMLGDVGKWFVSEGVDGTVLGRIVGLRNCFEYDVRSVTYREDGEGKLTLDVPSGANTMLFDREFTEVTPELMSDDRFGAQVPCDDGRDNASRTRDDDRTMGG